MSGFLVLSESESGVRVELKVMYNSVGTTADMLEKAIVGVMPMAFMEIEKRIHVDPGPQHLGTCMRCGKTYNLGVSCGDPGHEARRLGEDRKTAHIGPGEG